MDLRLARTLSNSKQDDDVDIDSDTSSGNSKKTVYNEKVGSSN
jgi:hypothetical protein